MGKEDGGSVHPYQELCASGMPQTAMWTGITLREYFATHADRDSISEITYRSLSRVAKAAIVGRPWPEELPANPTQDQVCKYQIALFDFEAELDCILRFKMADLMLKARNS